MRKPTNIGVKARLWPVIAAKASYLFGYLLTQGYAVLTPTPQGPLPVPLRDRRPGWWAPEGASQSLKTLLGVLLEG